jgi:hypothetical protein
LCDRGFSKETSKPSRLGNLVIGAVKPPSRKRPPGVTPSY